MTQQRRIRRQIERIAVPLKDREFRRETGEQWIPASGFGHAHGHHANFGRVPGIDGATERFRE